MAAGCSDSPLARSGDLASLSLSPQFGRAAFATAVTVDRMHIVLTRPPSTVPVFDTTIAIAPGQDSVAVTLKLQLLTSQDVFTATIDMLSGGTLVYHGSASVSASAGQKSGATTVTVSYVGPGATATRVVIAPRDTTIRATGTLAFSTTVFDASANALSNTPIAWNVVDATLGSITTPGGVFSGAGRRGTASVVATTPTGISDTVQLKLQPVATKLVVVSGDNQSAPAGSALPLPMVVEADGVDGAVAGVGVRFDAGTSGGSVHPDSVITDANGRASTQPTLGTTTGAQHFNATSAGLTSASVTATATAVATSIAKASGDGQADSVGVTLNPFVAKVTDAFGNAAPGAKVDWTLIGGTGSLSAASSAADASGLASIIYTLSKTSRTDSVRATLSGTNASVVFTASAFQRSAAKLVLVSGDAQIGVVGATLPVKFVVQAQDALGNVVTNAAVKFSTASVGASVNPPSATTDANGQAGSTLALGQVVGRYEFAATAGSATITVNANAIAAAASKLVKISGDNQVGVACADLTNPFVVQVLDPFGNGVVGASVIWAQTGGPGSHNSAELLTDSAGTSAVLYQLPNTAGVDTITAALKIDTRQSVTFLATITSTLTGSCPTENRMRAVVRKRH